MVNSPNELAEGVFRALRKVPECHLRIIELANEAVTPTGELDYEFLIDHQPDLNLAEAEAESYSKATVSARQALARIKCAK
jgi:hypothetical protein